MISLSKEDEINDEIERTLAVRDRIESSISFLAFLAILALLVYLKGNLS